MKNGWKHSSMVENGWKRWKNEETGQKQSKTVRKKIQKLSNMGEKHSKAVKKCQKWIRNNQKQSKTVKTCLKISFNYKMNIWVSRNTSWFYMHGKP